MYGRHFYLITDALSVKKIFEEDKVRKRVPIRFIRWKSDISANDITFVHREGSKNIADYLSRRFNPKISDITQLATTKLEQRVNTITEACRPTNISIEELVKHTNEDNQMIEIKKALLSTKDLKCFDILSNFKQIFKELSVSSHGIVLRNDVIVIPSKLQQKVIDYAHEGHNGFKLCKRLLRNICWFPKMDQMIENTIKECVPCQYTVKTTTTEPIMPTNIPPSAWHTIELDFSSRTPTNEYLLAVYDQHSRQNIQKLSHDMTTESAVRICKNFFIKYGVPKIIKSDNGPAFKSHAWAEFARKFNFIHQKITTLHPESNSGAERTMACTNKRIRCSRVDGTHWKVQLSNYLKRYNQTPNSATGFSPNMLLFGSEECDILPNICPRTLTQDMIKKAIDNDAKAKALMKKYADAYQHTKSRKFEVGDPVLHTWDRPNKHLPYFDPHPYRIKSKIGSMITAARNNQEVTRNSRHFKVINEKCYENAIGLLDRDQSKPVAIKFLIYPRHELEPCQNITVTPPLTLIIQSQPSDHLNLLDNTYTAYNATSTQGSLQKSAQSVSQSNEQVPKKGQHSMERSSSLKSGRLCYKNAFRMFPKSDLNDIDENL